MPKRSIAIIGGGVAGLAAAVTLANANESVTVFETHEQLGGRAKGIEYNGHTLDNGQHILLGAYRAYTYPRPSGSNDSAHATCTQRI
jgi:hydroxysqualene dehydroxylase